MVIDNCTHIDNRCLINDQPRQGVVQKVYNFHFESLFVELATTILLFYCEENTCYVSIPFMCSLGMQVGTLCRGLPSEFA